MKAVLSAIILVLAVTAARSQAFPSVKTFVESPFPPVAQAVRAEGDVQVLVEVDSNGNVVSAEAVSGHKLLQKTAEAVSKQWTFTALNGKHYITLTFSFRLSNYKDKKTAKLVRGYTLRFITPSVRILQSTDYQSSNGG